MDSIFIKEPNKGVDKYGEMFRKYVSVFKTDSDITNRNIELKVLHTYMVREIARELSCRLGLSDEEKQLAEIVALFHDIGRFKQLKEYGHFNDSTSINHAQAGIFAIEEEGFLKDLDSDKKDIVINAIRHHNKIKIPQGLTCDKVLLHAKIIRDADKVDIYRILVEKGEESNPEILKILYGSKSNENIISDLIYNKIINKEKVLLSEPGTIVEAQIARIAWLINDINFRQTIDIIVERGYVTKLYDYMQKSKRLEELYKFILNEIGYKKH